jgi:hypothetical protein
MSVVLYGTLVDRVQKGAGVVISSLKKGGRGLCGGIKREKTVGKELEPPAYNSQLSCESLPLMVVKVRGPCRTGQLQPIQ